MPDDDQRDINVTFLVLYCFFAAANMVLIAKFANRNELLHLFVMVTSLLALLCKCCMSLTVKVRCGLLLTLVIDTQKFQTSKRLYYFLYFEFPFHLFNLIAALILLQW